MHTGKLRFDTSVENDGVNLVIEAQAMRNPPWSRDELILALELYLSSRSHLPGTSSKQVIELSLLLSELASVEGVQANAEFRNANGVYMKLNNFRRFDPEYTASGRVGLKRGNKEEEAVWNDFADNPGKLKRVTASIRAAIKLKEMKGYSEDLSTVSAEEGKILTRLHKTRERNQSLISKKKARALAREGKLICEACGFDFEERYGPRGHGFIEAHHTRPLHTLGANTTTSLDDLALLCANCHRMIHSARPWLTIQELRSVLR